MTQEKKFFVPVLRTYGNDISKRWRVEYWAPTHNGQGAERKAIYGNINKGGTEMERLILANKVMVRVINMGEAKPKKRKPNLLERIIEISSIHWRKKTVEAYTTVCKSFTAFLGTTKPENATQDMVNSYLLKLYKEGRGSNTIEKYRSLLFTLYEKCIAQKMCMANPVQQVQRKRREPVSLQFFTESQINAILAAPKPQQLHLAIELLAYCFIRPGEQRNLRIGDFNFEQGFIEIRSDISKNRKSQKVVLPYHFLQKLEYLKEYPNSFFVLSKSGKPGPVPISTKYLNDEHAKVLDALKIRGRYAFYSWKHTGVVRAVKAGINIKDLQLQLRHHSLDMVNEYLKNLGVMMSEDLRNKFPAL